VSGDKAYLHAKFYLGPSYRFITTHQRHRYTRQTDRQQIDSIGRTVSQTVAQNKLQYYRGRGLHPCHGPSKSSVTYLVCGVPQGSVLRPILFVLYTVDLSMVIESYGLSPHMYADDTQVYGSCRPSAVTTFTTKVSGCVEATTSWIRYNRLQPIQRRRKFYGVRLRDVSVSYQLPHC